MKSHLPVKTSIIVMCLGVLFWAGCANFLQPEMGAVARPEARIAIPEKEVQKQTFTAGDVKIIYALAGASEPFALSGSIVFDQSLTYSFPIITKFLLKLNFLDGESRVIETIDITPVFGSFGRVPDKLDFRVSHVAPPGSKAIAFNYFGEFRSTPPETSGTWEIFYFPFD